MSPALPIHPHLTHPLTGLPLRAVFVSERTGRVYWPIVGAADDDGGDGGGSGGDGGDGGGSGGDAPAFPPNTPWRDMKPEEQVAYWQHQSRRHEERSRAFGNLTADELKALREKADRADALDADLATDQERAVNEATKATRAAADAEYRPQLVETAFRVAIGDRKTADEVTDFLDDLKLEKFLDDNGKVDTAKVLARVEQFAPATGNQQQQRKGPTATGHGSGNGGGTGTGGLSGLNGKELFGRLHPQPSSK